MGLQELKKRYINLAEMLPCAFFDLNITGNFIYINKKAKVLLGEEEGLLGAKLAEKVSKKHLFRLLTIFKEAVKKGCDKGEIEIKAVEGEQRVALEVVAVKGEEGVTGFHCYVKKGEVKEAPLSRVGDEIALALASARAALDVADKKKK